VHAHLLSRTKLQCTLQLRGHVHHIVHTEWRLLISGVHPIMMEKSALAGEGGKCTPTPFQPITITYKVGMYAPAERADTLPLFLPQYVLCDIHSPYFVSIHMYSVVSAVESIK
jgi:hypothetical protein